VDQAVERAVDRRMDRHMDRAVDRAHGSSCGSGAWIGSVDRNAPENVDGCMGDKVVLRLDIVAKLFDCRERLLSLLLQYVELDDLRHSELVAEQDLAIGNMLDPRYPRWVLGQASSIDEGLEEVHTAKHGSGVDWNRVWRNGAGMHRLG
jgi:hypothetical protein